MSGRYISLFSGIGGLDLAIEAFFGYEPAAFVEWDQSCQRVLAGHWPGVPIFGDIREFSAASLADPSGERHGGEQDGGGMGRVDGQDAGSAWQRQRPRQLAGDRSKSAGAAGTALANAESGGGANGGLATVVTARTGVPIGDDASRLGGVDLVCGGFPCQDLSTAGKGDGFKGKRSSLFYELARVVSDVGPRYVLLENVRGLLTANGSVSDARGSAMAEVTGTLADLGFTRIDWIMLGASDVGAPHRRHRIFILASDAEDVGRGIQGQGFDAEGSGAQDGPTAIVAHSRSSGMFADSDDTRLQGLAWDGIDRNEPGWFAPRSHGPGSEASGRPAPRFQWGTYEPAIRRWEAVMGPSPHPVDTANRLSPELVTWMMGFPAGWNEGESRTNRLKQLGNAVVWQQAYRALELIQKRETAPERAVSGRVR